MANKNRVRMYCHPDFKKMVDIRRIEYGGADSITFTEKASKNPDILAGMRPVNKDENKTKKTKYPSLFR